jgi:peroxiredoxin
MKMKRPTLKYALIIIALVLFAKTTYASDKKAPYFELKDLNSNKVRLTDFAGKVIILDFWATWCPPCKKEIPDFIELYKQYSKRGVTIIGIALDEYNAVKNFHSENKINYPILLGTDEVVKLYGGIRGIPTTFVIGKDGTIRQRYEGFRPKDLFEKEIKAALIK